MERGGIWRHYGSDRDSLLVVPLLGAESGICKKCDGFNSYSVRFSIGIVYTCTVIIERIICIFYHES